jgi:hypothetical protein
MITLFLCTILLVQLLVLCHSDRHVVDESMFGISDSEQISEVEASASDGTYTVIVNNKQVKVEPLHAALQRAMLTEEEGVVETLETSSSSSSSKTGEEAMEINKERVLIGKNIDSHSQTQTQTNLRAGSEVSTNTNTADNDNQRRYIYNKDKSSAYDIYHATSWHPLAASLTYHTGEIMRKLVGSNCLEVERGKYQNK